MLDFKSLENPLMSFRRVPSLGEFCRWTIFNSESALLLAFFRVRDQVEEIQRKHQGAPVR